MKHKEFKYPLLIGFVVSLIVLVTLSLTVPDISESPPKKPNTPDFLFENIVIRQFEKGRLTWEIRSDQATVDKADGKAYLKNMTGSYFKGKVPQLKLRSPDAWISLQNAHLNLRQADVDWILDSVTYHIRADKLDWNNDSQILAGNGAVSIASPELTLTGDSVNAYLLTEDVTLSGQPGKAVITPKPQRQKS